MVVRCRTNRFVPASGDTRDTVPVSIPPPPSPPPGWNQGWDRGGPGAGNPWNAPGDRPPTGYQPFGTTTWSNAREHPNGTTVLVLGILSLVACGLLGPVAWVMGNKALREMNAEPGVTFSNRGSVTAGRVCGIVGTAFVAIGMFVFALILLAVVSGQG